MRALAPLAALLCVATAWSADAPRVDFHADRLRQGVFTYQLSVKGKSIGVAKITIRKQPSGDFLIESDAEDAGQRWSSKLREDFTPLAADLHMFDGKKLRYHMELEYAGAQVKGHKSRGDEGKFVNSTIAGQVVDQRVDWAAMMTAVIPKSGVEFKVYDPETESSPVLGSSKPADPIDGVLGRQPAIALAYSIHKSDHVENYVVYATESLPRVMLREDMPNDLVAELIAVEP